MTGLRKSADTAVKRVKTTAKQARTEVEHAGSQAKAQAVKLADKVSGREKSRKRRKKRAAVAIAGVTAAAVATGITVAQVRKRKKRKRLI